MATKLKQARLSKIKSMKRMDDKPKEPAELPDLPPLREMADLLDPAVRELGRQLGDDKLAQRVIKLQNEYPMGSIPELVTLDWLRQQQIMHTYQGRLFGGRETRGGAVPDFIIPRGGSAIVWRIQGYYHQLPGAKDRDLVQKLKLLGSYFDGMQISTVVDLWEDRIEDKNSRPAIFENAMAGIEMGTHTTG